MENEFFDSTMKKVTPCFRMCTVSLMVGVSFQNTIFKYLWWNGIVSPNCVAKRLVDGSKCSLASRNCSAVRITNLSNSQLHRLCCQLQLLHCPFQLSESQASRSIVGSLCYSVRTNGILSAGPQTPNASLFAPTSGPHAPTVGCKCFSCRHQLSETQAHKPYCRLHMSNGQVETVVHAAPIASLSVQNAHLSAPTVRISAPLTLTPSVFLHPATKNNGWSLAVKFDERSFTGANDTMVLLCVASCTSLHVRLTKGSKKSHTRKPSLRFFTLLCSPLLSFALLLSTLLESSSLFLTLI